MLVWSLKKARKISRGKKKTKKEEEAENQSGGVEHGAEAVAARRALSGLD